jgi:acylpyruvate hydrolase
MRLVTYTNHHPPRTGAVWQDQVIDLGRAYAAMLRDHGDDCVSQPLIDALVPGDLVELLRGGHRTMDAASAAFDWAVQRATDDATPRSVWNEPVLVALADVDLQAPVQLPRKILCVGLNYRDHAEEQGAKLPRNPILFGKYPPSLIGHGQTIHKPAITEQLDYEAELAVIIGRGGRFIEESDALVHVAGYAAFNDITSRDIQFADRQWLRGKMGDTHAPLGPWMVTADELPDPSHLDISLSRNGDVLQSSNTEQLIFDIPHLIHFISQSVTLEPGDVIATGTPGGVGFARDPQVFLEPGDRVRVEIEGIGALENVVAAE